MFQAQKFIFTHIEGVPFVPCHTHERERNLISRPSMSYLLFTQSSHEQNELEEHASSLPSQEFFSLTSRKSWY